MGFVYNYPRGAAMSVRRRIQVFLECAPTLLIPVVIVGFHPHGLANATEAAAVGAVAAILVGKFWFKELHLRQLPAMFLRAGIYSAAVLFLVAAAAVFTWVLIYAKVPQEVARWVQTAAHDPVTFMLVVNVALLVIGTVIDGAPG